MEDRDGAINAIKEADYLIFLIGSELDTFSHLEELDYDQFDFWRDFPEFKQELEIPAQMLTPEYLEENPGHFWGRACVRQSPCGWLVVGRH